MVLRRSPDPADIPVNPGRLLRRGTEVDLLDEVPIGVGHDEAHSRIGADPGANHPWLDLIAPVARVFLPAILESYRQQQRRAGYAARLDQLAHLRAGRIESPPGGVGSNRRRVMPWRVG